MRGIVPRQWAAPAKSEWEPAPSFSARDTALARGKYWLPDLIDTEPPLEVKKNPRRTSKFAQDFEDQESSEH